jgi:hypothetical protein
VLESLSKLFGEVGEIRVLGKRAQDNKDDFPFCKIGVLNDVRQILSDDRLENSEERSSGRVSVEVGFLSGSQQVGSTSDSKQESVGEPFGSKTEVDSGFEIAKDECLGD